MRIKKNEYINGEIKTTTVKDFKELKSKSSYRTLGLDKALLNLLKEHKERQKELAKKNNIEFTENDWVFTTRTYKGFVRDYLRDKIKKAMKELKIENYESISSHNIRHTYCTMGLQNGTDIKVMSKLMGHSNIGVTANVYAHIEEKKLIEETNKVQGNITKYL